MPYNPLHKLQDNIAALRIALAVSPGTAISEQELEQIKRYSGFGGLKAVLYGDGKAAIHTDQWRRLRES